MTEPSRAEEVRAELLILAEEQDDRFLADYDAWFHPERERVEKRVSEAGEFLAAIKAYIGNQTA